MSLKAPSILSGFVLPVKSVSPSSLYGDDEFQYLDIASVDRDTRSILSPQTIQTADAPSRARQLVQANDIIVSTVRPNLNTVAHVVAEYDGAIASTGFCVLRANPEVLDHRYLYHWISSQKSVDYLVSVATGASYPAVSDKIIKGMDFDPPPLEEQKRIAAILDKADSLRRKRAQAIALADGFLRATFLDLFGDPVTNPKGWEVCSVGDVTTCIVPGRDKPKSFTGTTPWVTTKDLIHLGLTSNSVDGLGLDDDEIAGVKAKTVPSGAVLMTCVGDLGVLSITGSEMVINQQLHAFLCSHEVMNSFLMYALSFQKSYMQSMASSTTLPYMNKTVCNGIPVFKPPLPLQKQFNDFFLKIQALKKTLSVSADSGTVLMSACAEKYLNI